MKAVDHLTLKNSNKTSLRPIIREEGQFRDQAGAMFCGLPLSKYALISEDKLQRKLNDSGTGAEAQNFTEVGSADVADGVVPIRMIQ